MSSIDSKEAQGIANQAALEYHAREVLAEGRPWLTQLLCAIASCVAGAYVGTHFEAPVLVQIAFVFLLALVPQQVIELYRLRRRFDAALVLLRIQNSDR